MLFFVVIKFFEGSLESSLVFLVVYKLKNAVTLIGVGI